MSNYEGKNCFRTVLSQKPVYSGSSNIVASRIQIDHLFSSSSSEQQNNNTIDLTTFAFGSTLNIVNRQTGRTIASRDLGLEDDVILNIDAVVVRHEAEEVSQDGCDAKKQETPKAHLRPVLYVAASTRSLQIYVFSLHVALLADAKRKIKKIEKHKARNKNRILDENPIDEAFTKTQLVEDDPLGVTYALSLVKSWTADQSAVSCLKFSPKTYHLASGSADGGLKVWNVVNHYLTHSFRGQNSGVVTSLAFLNEDESLLAAGTFEGYITVIDFSSKKIIASGRPHTSSVEAISLTTRSEKDKGQVLLISASRDRNVTVFEAKSLKALRTIVLGHPLLACNFASPFVGFYGCENGLLGAFAVSPETFGVVVFAIRDAPIHGTEEEHSVRGITFYENNNNNISNNGQRHAILPQTILVVDASFRLFTLNACPQGNVGNGGTLDKPFAATLETVRTDILNFDQIMDIKFFPSSTENKKRANELVIATNARDAYVTRSAGSSQLRGTLQGHSDLVVAVDVSPDGTKIATASKDMEARIWDSETLRCIAKTSASLKIHTAELTAIKFLPNFGDIQLLSTVSFDSVLASWDLSPPASAIKKITENNNNYEILDLPNTSSIANCHEGATYCLAASPNGQFLVTGGKDKAVRLWSLKGKRIAREGVPMRGHRRTVSCVAFSPVDKIVVSGSNDGAMRLWSISTQTCIRTLQIDTVPILQVAFFNKGTQLVAVNAEGVSRFWATAAGECVAITTPHTDRSWALCLREEEVAFEKMSLKKRNAAGEEFLFEEEIVGDDQEGHEDEEENEEEEEIEEDEGEEEEENGGKKKTYLRTILLTGGADGTLVCQEDFTDQKVEELRVERQDNTMKEQQLRNTMREGDFKDAFKLALSLNHPRHLRQVLSNWMAKTNRAKAKERSEDNTAEKESGKRRQRGEDDDEVDFDFEQQEEEEDECEKQVGEIIVELSTAELQRLFAFTRVWLTNAKHSGPASLVVAATLKALPPSKLENLAAFAEVAEALQAYSKRHLNRLRKTQDHLFYLEFLTKGQMTGVN